MGSLGLGNVLKCQIVYKCAKRLQSLFWNHKNTVKLVRYNNTWQTRASQNIITDTHWNFNGILGGYSEATPIDGDRGRAAANFGGLQSYRLGKFSWFHLTFCWLSVQWARNFYYPWGYGMVEVILVLLPQPGLHVNTCRECPIMVAVAHRGALGVVVGLQSCPMDNYGITSPQCPLLSVWPAWLLCLRYQGKVQGKEWK